MHALLIVRTELFRLIGATLRGDGNVLVAGDSAGRMLELLKVFADMWSNRGKGTSLLGPYKLIFLTNQARQTLNYAKSLNEYMSEPMKKAFIDENINAYHIDVGGPGPINSSVVHVCHSIWEVEQFTGPKCVLTGLDGLETGHARELFINWARSKSSLLLFTGSPAPGTLGRQLVDHPGKHRVLELDVKRRVDLQGIELQQYRKKKQLEREEAARAAKEEEEAAAMVEGGVEEEEEEDSGVLLRHDIMSHDRDHQRRRGNKAQGKTYDMFPIVDEHFSEDEYGEKIDPEDFKTAADLKREEIDAMQDSERMAVDTAADTEEIPTKCEVSRVHLEVKMAIKSIDVQGRVDGKSIKNIIKTIKPSQLMVIHGSREESEHLVDFCCSSDDYSLENAHCPQVDECVNVTSDRNIYQVKLTDNLVSSLKFATVAGSAARGALDSEVAWVDGRKGDAMSGGTTVSGGDTALEVPTLNMIPKNEVMGHSTVMVGELRLQRFKEVLAGVDITSYFSGGVLIVEDANGNGVIAVKRGGKDGAALELEGNVSTLYYLVRDLLYGQFAVV